MLKIAVCVKQVPKGDAQMDNKTGLLIRKELATNPYDYFAIETALQIKDNYNAKIDIFSLCPKIPSDSFKDYYSLGVNNCYHITDKAFKGADVYSTAYALSQAISKTDNYDLIICGRQTTDGDTSAVSGSIAESLKIPSIMYVKSIDSILKNKVIVTHELTNFIEKIEIKMPCVLSIDKDTVTPRIPTLMGKLKANKMEPIVMTLKDLKDQNLAHYGEQGSKTKVIKVYEETIQDKGIKIEGNISELSSFIVNKIKEIK